MLRVNSLAPGRFKVNFRWLSFKLVLVVNGWGISCETALIWMSLDHTYDNSTLVQVMAWCRQATSHYLSQCWPRSMSPYGVTRPQWVNPSSTILLPSAHTRPASPVYDDDPWCLDIWWSTHNPAWSCQGEPQPRNCQTLTLKVEAELELIVRV